MEVLLYFLEQGSVEQTIISQCMRENLPLPDKIQNAPDLLPGLELYYLAFMELSDSRSMGMSLGPISWKVIHDYCVAIGLDTDQTEEMHYHLKQLDMCYLEHHRSKSK